MPPQRFVFGNFVFEVGRATLFSGTSPIAVGQRGLAILHLLLNEHGRTVTKAELLDAAWPAAVVEESNLTVQIAALRKILGRAPDGTEWIVTVPRVGYRFAPVVAANEGAAPPAPSLGASQAGRKPSIVVLPFANLSDNSDQEYFADGLTEDIIGALLRFRWFHVIARHSSFLFKGSTLDIKEIARRLEVQYVVAGSVRKSGQQIRVSAQLIDPRNAHQLWSDRYEFQLGEGFAVQDQITEQVAGAIEPELLKTQAVLAAQRRHAADANALDMVYQGIWYFHQITRTNHLQARELFRKARDLDSDLPEAHLWVARVNAGLVAYEWSDDAQDDLREGIYAALMAVQIDDKNPYAHYGLAIVSVYAGLLEQAVRAAEKAMELSPSFALGHLVLGMARLFSGSASEAIQPLEHGIGFNPNDPQNFVWYNTLALAYMFSNNLSKARDNALKALKVRPVWRPSLETLTCCYSLLGDPRSAGLCVEQILKLDKPGSDAFGPLRRGNPKWASELGELLQSAGLNLATSGRG